MILTDPGSGEGASNLTLLNRGVCDYHQGHAERGLGSKFGCQLMAVVDAPSPPLVADKRTDFFTVLFGLWMMIGLFLDGYAHTNLIDELESFITPWHAVFYSGFLATAAWIGWNIWKTMRTGLGLMESIPRGYGLAVAGILVFAIGGVGDAIWHTVYGIEAGVDALLSPTHLVLFTGIMLIMATPLRTAPLRISNSRLIGLDRASVILSVTLITSLLAFFFTYIWAPGESFFASQPFVASTGEGVLYVGFGIGSIMVSNLILLGPLVAALTRFRPPLGMVTISWLVANALNAAAFDLDLGKAVILGLAGGIVADALIFLFQAGPEKRWRSLVVLTVAPFVGWTAYFITIAIEGDLTWPLELTGGAVFFAALSGLALGLLAFPTPTQVGS